MNGAARRIFHNQELERRFKRDGYVVVKLLSRAKACQLLETFDRFADHHRQGFTASLLSPDLEYRRMVNEEVMRLIGPHVAALLRDYRHICSGFAVKQPDPERGAMPLHQDITMVPEGGRPALSLWAPLVDTNHHNGCLQVVAGSHLLNRRPRAPGTPSAAQAHEAEIRALYLRAIEARAGEAILLDQATFHASPANMSTAVRPVAVSVLAPLEQPVVYYHRHLTEAGVMLEGFEVREDFYLSHQLGTRPEAALSFGLVNEMAEPISSLCLATLPPASVAAPVSERLNPSENL